MCLRSHLVDMIPELKVSQGVSLFPKLVNMMGCIIDCIDVLMHAYTAVIRLTRIRSLYTIGEFRYQIAARRQSADHSWYGDRSIGCS